MKNREKYREELMNIVKLESTQRSRVSTFCDFVKNNVLPNYTNEECCNFWCNTCTKLFAFWLDEEYTEPLKPMKPKVDWNTVPVDTLVRVRDGEYEKWRLRYFSGFFEYDSLKYATWNSGRTSKTAEGTDDFTTWRYCELVEDADDK